MARNAHVDRVNRLDASKSVYDPTVSGLTATDVKAAIDENAAGIAAAVASIPASISPAVYVREITAAQIAALGAVAAGDLAFGSGLTLADGDFIVSVGFSLELDTGARTGFDATVGSCSGLNFQVFSAANAVAAKDLYEFASEAGVPLIYGGGYKNSSGGAETVKVTITATGVTLDAIDTGGDAYIAVTVGSTAA